MTFDIVIMDEHGSELIEIEAFTMKKVDDLDAALTVRPRQTFHQVMGNLYTITDDEPMAGDNEILRQHLQEGILPQEGAEAFNRILGGNVLPQIVVATKDLETMIQQVNAFGPSQLVEAQAQQVATSAHPRPNVQMPYVAPRDEFERHLADIWQALLGIEPIGIHDNFFELGGTHCSESSSFPDCVKLSE